MADPADSAVPSEAIMADEKISEPNETGASGARARRPVRPTRRHVVLSVAIALVVAALSYLVLSAIVDDGEDEPIAAGTLVKTEPAPVTEFPTLDGSTTSLADYRGKPVVLNFFAESCIPCRKEMPDLEKVHQEIGDRVTVLGIDQGDTEEVAKAFVEEVGVTYDIGRDPTGDLAREFGVDFLPGTVFITRGGDIAAVHRGQLSYDDLRRLVDEHLR